MSRGPNIPETNGHPVKQVISEQRYTTGLLHRLPAESIYRGRLPGALRVMQKRIDNPLIRIEFVPITVVEHRPWFEVEDIGRLSVIGFEYWSSIGEERVPPNKESAWLAFNASGEAFAVGDRKISDKGNKLESVSLASPFPVAYVADPEYTRNQEEADLRKLPEDSYEKHLRQEQQVVSGYTTIGDEKVPIYRPYIAPPADLFRAA